MAPASPRKDKKKELKKDKKKEKESTPAWQWLTENIECLATAVVMALMLNQFIIQAYKIPTGSMQPTIMGDERQGIFDRILVNKFIYFVSDPERWDVFVFKYPLDQSQNYIKRLIGLPGEKVGIHDGDIYINDKIARKPENATSAVLKQLFPPPGGEPYFSNFFVTDGDCKSMDGDTVVFSGSGTVKTKAPITCMYLDGYNVKYGCQIPRIHNLEQGYPVGDIRLAFQAELIGEEGGLQVALQENGRVHKLYLSGEGNASASRIMSGPMTAGNGSNPPVVWEDPNLNLEEGRGYDIVFSHIDDRITLSIDGDELAVFEYDAAPGAPREDESYLLAFGPEGCGAELTDVEVYRDIYYLPNTGQPGPFNVPEGHYFAMGDNTQNSVDSRCWKTKSIELKNGREVVSDFTPEGGNPRIQIAPQGYLITDIYGEDRYVPIVEMKKQDIPSISLDPASFVPRSLVLGKAMVVFWPMFPHFRWKLLR